MQYLLISRIYALIIAVVITFIVTGCGGGGGGNASNPPPDNPPPVTFGEHFVLFSARETVDVPTQLFLGELDGSSEPTKLSDIVAPNGGVVGFQSAPDKTAVAWVSTNEIDEAELYVVSAENMIPTKVTVIGNFVVEFSLRMAWAPDSSRLAFIADPGLDGTFKLYTCLPDGSDLKEVSGNLVESGDVMDFSWSPDSTRIAYSADQEIDNLIELYSSNSGGAGNLKISEQVEVGISDMSGSVMEFSWSPNSSRIAYHTRSITGQHARLFSNTVDGGDQLQMNGAMVDGGNVMKFAWSPDGSYLAYIADQDVDGTLELYTTSAESSAPVKINPLLVADGGVAEFGWAPDSHRLAYIADQIVDEKFELFSDLPEGGDNQKVNQPIVSLPGSGVRTFSWAPDSGRIAYVIRHLSFIPPLEIMTNFRLYSALADGSVKNKINLGSGSVKNDSFFAWSPNSERIAYIDFNGGGYHLATALADGTDNILIDSPVPVSVTTFPFFMWSKDSDRIVHIANQLSTPPSVSSLRSSGARAGDDELVSGSTITTEGHIVRYSVK